MKQFGKSIANNETRANQLFRDLFSVTDYMDLHLQGFIALLQDYLPYKALVT